MSGFGKPWNRNIRQNRNRQTRNLPQTPWMINPPWLGGQMDDFIPPAPDPPIISNQRDVQTQDYLQPPALIPSNSFNNIDYTSDNVYFDNFSSHNPLYTDYPPPPILEPQQYSTTYPSKPPQQYISYPVPIKYQTNLLPNSSNSQEINQVSQSTPKNSNQKKSARGKSSSDTKSDKSRGSNRKQTKSSYHSSSWSNNKSYNTSRLPSPPPPPILTPQVPATPPSKSPRSNRKEQTSRTLKSRNTKSKDKPTKNDKSDKKKSSTIKPLSASAQTATKKPSDKLPTKLDKNTILKLVNSTTKYEPAMQKLLREQRSQLTQNLRNKYNEKQNTTSANTSSNAAGNNDIDELIPADEIIPNFTVDLIEELRFLTDVIESDSNTVAEELKANIKEDKSSDDDKLILLDEWTDTKKDVDDVDDTEDGNVTNGDGNDYDMGPIELPSNIDELQLPTDVSSFFNFTEINKDPDLDQTDIETFNSVHIVDKENIGTCPNLVSTTLSPIKKDAMSELINNIALDDSTKLVSEQHVMFPINETPLTNGADDIRDDITLSTQVVEPSEPPVDVLNNNEHQDKVNKSDETLFFANKQVESERSSLKHSLDNFRQTLRSEILNTAPHVPKRTSANKIYNKSSSNNDYISESPGPSGVCTVNDDKIDNTCANNELLNTNNAICESKCNFMNINSVPILNEKIEPIDEDRAVDEVDHVFTKSTNHDGNNTLQADQLVNVIDKDATDKSVEINTKNDERNIQPHDLISSEPNLKVLKIKLEKLDETLNLTTGNIEQNLTSQNIEDFTIQNNEENLPTQNIEENLTTQNTEENLTTQNYEENLTTQNIEEHLTTENIEENLITQNIKENLTTENTEKYLITHNSEVNLSTQSIKENFATQNIKENLITQNTEENLTTQNIEQKDSIKPDVETSKEELQMPKDKGVNDEPHKEIESIKHEAVKNEIFSQPEILSEHQSVLITNDSKIDVKNEENIRMKDVLEKQTDSNLTEMKLENENLTVKIEEKVKMSSVVSEENAANISEIVEIKENIANTPLNSEIKVETAEITLAENIKCENPENIDIKPDTHAEVQNSEHPNLPQAISLTNHQLTSNIKDLNVTVQVKKCTDIEEMTETSEQKIFETPQICIKNDETPVKTETIIDRENVTDRFILNKTDKKLKRIRSKPRQKSEKSKALKRKKLLKMLKNLEIKQLKIMTQKQMKKVKQVKKHSVKNVIHEPMSTRERTPERKHTPTTIPLTNESSNVSTSNNIVNRKWRSPGEKKIIQSTNENEHLYANQNVLTSTIQHTPQIASVATSSTIEKLITTPSTVSTISQESHQSMQEILMKIYEIDINIQKLMEEKMNLYSQLEIISKYSICLSRSSDMEVDSSKTNISGSSIVSEQNVEANEVLLRCREDVEEQNTNQITCKNEDISTTVENNLIEESSRVLPSDSFKELENSHLINKEDRDASVDLSKELQNSQSLKKEDLPKEMKKSRSLNKKVSSDPPKELKNSQLLNRIDLDTSTNPPKELQNSRSLTKKHCDAAALIKEPQNSQSNKNLEASSNHSNELQNSQLSNEGMEKKEENLDTSSNPSNEAQISQPSTEKNLNNTSHPKELENSQSSTNLQKHLQNMPLPSDNDCKLKSIKEEIPEEITKISIPTQNQPAKVEPKSTNDNKTEKTIESVGVAKKALRPAIVRRKAETENEDEGKIKPVSKKSKASAFKNAFKDKNPTQMESTSIDDLQAKTNDIFTSNKTNFGSVSFNKKSKNYLRQKSTDVSEDHTKEVNVKKDSRSSRKRKLLVIDDSSDAESVVSQGSLTKISRRTPQNPLKSTQLHIESSDTESVLSHCSTNSKTKQSETVDRKIRETSIETKPKSNKGRKPRIRTPSKSAKTKSEDEILEAKESDKTNQYDFLKPCTVTLTPIDVDVFVGKNHTTPHKSTPTRITTASDENSHSEFEDAPHDLIVLDEVGFETDDSSTKDIKNEKVDTIKSETPKQNTSKTTKEIDDNKTVKLSTDENLKFQNHKGSILHVKLYESYLIAAGEDGNLYKYDINSGKLMATGKGHWEAITCFVIPQTKNSVKHIYSGSLDAHFRSFNLKTLSAKLKFKVDSSIQCMDSDWGYIFIGTISGHMYRFSIEQNNFMDEKRRIGGQTLLALKATREGGRRVLIVAPRNEMVSIRDAMTGLLLRYLSFTSVSYTIYSVLLCDSIIYCGTSQKMILAYNFTDGRNLAHMTAGKGVVCLIEYKKLLFAGCYDGNIYVFDLKTRENVVTLPGPGSMVLALDVTDNKIIVGCKNSSLEVIQMPEVIHKYINDR